MDARREELGAETLQNIEAAGQTMRQTVSDSISTLRDKMIGFGAHTDTHAHGEKCGCGAIDNAPAIIRSAVTFKDQIRASIEALGIDTTGLEEVEAAYTASAGSELGDYAGAEVMNEIINNGKIVKELDDNHKEVIVILNTVENHTLDK